MAKAGVGLPSTVAFFWATLVLWSLYVAFEISANGRGELLVVACSFCFFQVANWAVRHFLSTDALFVNTCVSLLHSTLTTCFVLTILANQWMGKRAYEMFEHEQLFGGTWPGSYSALCLSCGYFAYDQLDMLRYQLHSGYIPSILVHHLILLICFTLALHRTVALNYLILTLVCELHSIFLHVRKVRRLAGVRNVRVITVRIEWILNWTTFFVARVACHILITCKLIKDASKFGEGIELPLALLGMAGMNILNLFLGIDLFRAYKREKNKKMHDG